MKKTFLNNTVFYLTVILILLTAIFSAGCIDTQERIGNTSPTQTPSQIQMAYEPDMYVQNISGYVLGWVVLENWNLTDGEIIELTNAFEKKYEKTYNQETGWYELNEYEFHTSLMQAANLTEEERKKFEYDMALFKTQSFESNRVHG